MGMLSKFYYTIHKNNLKILLFFLLFFSCDIYEPVSINYAKRYETDFTLYAVAKETTIDFSSFISDKLTPDFEEDKVEYVLSNIDGDGDLSKSGVFKPQKQGVSIITCIYKNEIIERVKVEISDKEKKFEPVLFGGRKYRGIIKYSTDEKIETSYENTNVQIVYPTVKEFEAEGFFVIEGKYSDSEPYGFTIKTEDGSHMDTYKPEILTDNRFQVRLWMRAGAGFYTVDAYGYSFRVLNTAEESGVFYYPTRYVQSDYIDILNKAVVLTRLYDNDYDKINALDNWVRNHVSYDIGTVGVNQDSISVFHSGVAVCEGYTTLLNALLRVSGFKAKCVWGHIPAGYHAWTNVLVDGSWYLIDATWSKKYFMLEDLTGINGDHAANDINDNINRSITE